MGYELHALIGRTEPIARAAAELTVAPVALPQGFALLPGPVPDDAAADALPTDDQPFWWLGLDFEWAAVTASHVGPVSYLETEFFGGVGNQAAVVWQDGQIVLGPLREDDEEHPERRLPLTEWPINRALRHLGVRAEPDGDEFAVLGLGRYRDTDNWRATPSPSS